MNAKAIIFNISSASLLTFGLVSAYALNPAKEQPVQITSPSYIVDDMDLGPYNDCTTECTATLLTSDDEYQIEVNFDFSGFKDGNGFQSWNDAEIDRLEPLSVVRYEDESPVNADIDNYEIELMNKALVAEILKKRA